MHTLEHPTVPYRRAVATPAELWRSHPPSPRTQQVVRQARATVRRILDGADHRLLVVVGPCSVHDPEAALEYAHRLRALADRVDDTLYLVMRAYCEKPRTTVGWKGLVSDPRLDGSARVGEGLALARALLLELAGLGVPAAVEAADPITQPYLQDLVAWTAIGARSVESQPHRETASGLASPVGFENRTDGDLLVAADAMEAAARPHRFLGVGGDGRVSVVQTRGNAATHLVLRGGRGGRTNHDAASVAAAERLLAARGLPARLMVDCSHANSGRRPAVQRTVAHDVAGQIGAGNRSVRALMLESNLHAGTQSVVPGRPLRRGVSITDPCLSWESTEALLGELRERLGDALARRQATAAARAR